MAIGKISRRFPLGLGSLPVVTAVVCAGLFIAPPSSGLGQTDDPVLRVEEDWQVVLNEPDGAVNAPQFHTLMSPLSDTSSVYAQVTWNYREIPDAAAGGAQIQAWNGEHAVQMKDRVSNQLSTIAETISWTQRLETNGSLLRFRVVNGQSTTWGSFGGSEWNVEGNANLANLNGYSTEVSVDKTAITYGSNRIDSLIITEVRYYGASGLLWTDSDPKVVFGNE
jgi:hypothetical protein